MVLDEDFINASLSLKLFREPLTTNTMSDLANVVAPTLGAIIANGMFLAHMPAVREAVRRKDLGSLGIAVVWKNMLLVI